MNAPNDFSPDVISGQAGCLAAFGAAIATPNQVTKARPFRVGQRVRRSSVALSMLHAIGINVPEYGTVTGYSTGKYKGCVTVRVDGSKRGEPFKLDQWRPAGAGMA